MMCHPVDTNPSWRLEFRLASRALADSPGGGGGGSILGWASPPGESEDVTDATDEVSFVAPDDDVTEGRMSAAIEKRLEPRGSFKGIISKVWLIWELGVMYDLPNFPRIQF